VIKKKPRSTTIPIRKNKQKLGETKINEGENNDYLLGLKRVWKKVEWGSRDVTTKKVRVLAQFRISLWIT
jgi:hypothetical protein